MTAATGFVLALSAIPAWAQPAATAAAADAGSDSAAPAAAGDQLQEVVVTAERRDVSLLQTPIAITAVSGQAILENHLIDVNSLQQVTPAFSVNDQGGYFQSVNIRGIGNTALDPAITTGVAVFRDGLLQAETIGQEYPLYDIADTEVLEGPQGTLVGASSTAGAVQINSANPNFRGINGFVDTTFATYSDKKVTGAVNMPVTDTLALRVAFNTEYRGSFYRSEGAALQGPGTVDPINDPGQVQNINLRIGALWRPTDAFQALFKYEYNRSNTGGEPAEPITSTYTSLFSGCTANGANGSIVCPSSGAPSHTPFYYPGEQPFVLDYGSTDTEEISFNQRFNLELRYTFADGVIFRSQTGVQQFGFNHIAWNSYGPYNAGYIWHELHNDQYFSEEVNLISPTTGKLNWIVGAFAFYRNTPVELANQIYVPPYQLPIAAATPSEYANMSPLLELLGTVNGVARTGAVFAQVGWHFTDTLQLQLGLRENWDDNFNQQDASDGIYLFPFVPPNQLPGTTISTSCVPGGSKVACWFNGGRFTDAVPTGKVNLSWTPVPTQNFFVFYARGYKSGGANGNNTASDPYPTFAPEHVNDWELGWKGSLLDNHLQTQLGLYYMNYQGMQYPVYDIYSPSQAQLVENLAASTIDGIEFSAQSRFGRAGINVGVDYNHSSLGAVTALNNAYLPGNTPFGFNQASGPAQCPATAATAGCFNYLPYEQKLSGEQMPFSPKFTANVTVDYGFPIGASTLRPRITYNHSDGQYASLFEDAYSYLGPHDLIGANLDFEVGPWLFEAYGTNLTNQLYLSGKTATVQYYGAPRQVGFRFNRTF
jgi:iron complex outermembrane receptor protein